MCGALNENFGSAWPLGKPGDEIGVRMEKIQNLALQEISKIAGLRAMEIMADTLAPPLPRPPSRYASVQVSRLWCIRL